MNTDLPLRFEYADYSYLPRAAFTAKGEPYTGKTSSSLGIADWMGSFKEGIPDGEFLLVLGDRVSSKVWFENGIMVKQEP